MIYGGGEKGYIEGREGLYRGGEKGYIEGGEGLYRGGEKGYIEGERSNLMRRRDRYRKRYK